MVSQLTSEKWGYHQDLNELQFYPTESFKSFDISKARTWQPIQAGGARPQGDGGEQQREVGPWLIIAIYQTLTFGKGVSSQLHNCTFSEEREWDINYVMS